MDEDTDFGSVFARLCGRTRLTQAELARAIGISEVTIRNWEAGISTPRVENLQKACEVFLEKGVFPEGRERDEAKALWKIAQRQGKRHRQQRLKADFDEEWFKQLIEKPSLQQDDKEKKPSSYSQPSKTLSRRTFLLVSVACLTGGGVIGGVIGNAIGRNSFLYGAWSQAENLNVGRYYLRATTLKQGTILATGGSAADGSYPTLCEVFDPSTGTWTKTESTLHAGRDQHTATLLRTGKVLVAGGWAGSGEDPRVVAEIYDPATGLWTQVKQPMIQARARHTATLLTDGRVLVVGGVEVIPSNGQPLATAEVYDPMTDRWTAARMMPIRRADHCAVLLPDGTVLVAGGTQKNDGSTKTRQAELYDPGSDTWQSVQGMSVPRAYHTAVLLHTGKILVIGGRADGYSSTNMTECYDPMTKSWSRAGNMNVARENSLGQEALVLPDGTVLIAGGDSAGTSEIYTPTTDIWIMGPKMHAVHYYGATALLKDGRVLVVGGEASYSSTYNAPVLPSTEVYREA